MVNCKTICRWHFKTSFYIHSQSLLLLLTYGFQAVIPEKPKKCLKNALFRWKRGGQICQKNKPKNFNRKDRKEAKFKSGFFVFLFFLSELCVFAVRMLQFKKHIQQQENQRLYFAFVTKFFCASTLCHLLCNWVIFKDDLTNLQSSKIAKRSPIFESKVKFI